MGSTHLLESVAEILTSIYLICFSFVIFVWAKVTVVCYSFCFL